MVKLLKLIRTKPCLYDTSFVSTPEEQEKAWCFVKREMHRSVETCKAQWLKYLKILDKFHKDGTLLPFPTSEMDFVIPHLNKLLCQMGETKNAIGDDQPDYQIKLEAVCGEENNVARRPDVDVTVVPAQKKARRPEIDTMPDDMLVNVASKSSDAESTTRSFNPKAADHCKPNYSRHAPAPAELQAFGTFVGVSLRKFSPAKQVSLKGEIFRLLQKAESEDLERFT